MSTTGTGLEQLFEQACEKISDINEHVATLSELVLSYKVAHVTELGTRTGISTLGFLHGLSLSSKGPLHSYDIERFPQVDTLYRVAKDNFLSFYFHLEDVLEADLSPTDLLFIDTYHTYTQLYRELYRHQEKARKLIVLHDTETFGVIGEDEGKGLKHALGVFLVEHPHWQVILHYPNNNGLTVLERL